MTDRAVSTVLSYALILGIVSILTATLFVSASGFVENERQETVHSTLEVTGHSLAADLETADRLARSGDTQRVVVTSELPDRVAGAQYWIDITGDGDDRYEITLRSVDPDVSVTVSVRSATEIPSSSVDGGDVEIAYDESNDELVVRDA